MLQHAPFVLKPLENAVNLRGLCSASVPGLLVQYIFQRWLGMVRQITFMPAGG